jgi:four helix bundle protein
MKPSSNGARVSSGLDVIVIVEEIPQGRTADVIGRQLIRCATSVGANYRAACRAKSRADLVAKLAIVEEEADETQYWLELLVDSGLASKTRVETAVREASEIVAMTVASIRTLRRGLPNPKSNT